jgi:hypothetical protein
MGFPEWASQRRPNPASIHHSGDVRGDLDAVGLGNPAFFPGFLGGFTSDHEKVRVNL